MNDNFPVSEKCICCNSCKQIIATVKRRQRKTKATFVFQGEYIGRVCLFNYGLFRKTFQFRACVQQLVGLFDNDYEAMYGAIEKISTEFKRLKGIQAQIIDDHNTSKRVGVYVPMEFEIISKILKGTQKQQYDVWMYNWLSSDYDSMSFIDDQDVTIENGVAVDTDFKSNEEDAVDIKNDDNNNNEQAYEDIVTRHNARQKTVKNDKKRVRFSENTSVDSENNIDNDRENEDNNNGGDIDDDDKEQFENREKNNVIENPQKENGTDVDDDDDDDNGECQYDIEEFDVIPDNTNNDHDDYCDDEDDDEDADGGDDNDNSDENFQDKKIDKEFVWRQTRTATDYVLRNRKKRKLTTKYNASSH